MRSRWRKELFPTQKRVSLQRCRRWPRFGYWKAFLSQWCKREAEKHATRRAMILSSYGRRLCVFGGSVKCV